MAKDAAEALRRRMEMDLESSRNNTLKNKGLVTQRSFTSSQTRSRSMSIISTNVTHNALTNKLYGSSKKIEEAQDRMQEAPFMTLHPYSGLRIMWDILTMVLLFAVMLLVPMNIAFFPVRGNAETKEAQKSLDVFFFITDLWFIIDIIINLRTGALVQKAMDTDITFDSNEIRRIYVSSWHFFIDLISSIPWDRLVRLGMDNQETDSVDAVDTLQHLRFLRLLKILTLLKLLRIARLAKAIHKWEEILDFQYNITISETSFKILQLGMLICSIVHLNACVLYMVPSLLDFPDKESEYGECWPVRKKINDTVPLHEASFISQYTWSLFMAASHMLVIGYAGHAPISLPDLAATLWSMLSGQVMFAIMLSEITCLIRSMEHSGFQYKQKLTKIKEFMQFCKLPGELRGRIQEYYDVKFQGKMFDEKKILSELNPILREKVINYNCRSQLKSIDFLRNLDQNVLSELMSYLKFDIYLEGDEIIKEGAIDPTVYFINHGTVFVKSEYAPQEEGTILSEGDHFGEFALLLPNLKRPASVIAKTNVCVYSITTQDFDEVLKWYPSEREFFLKVSRDRIKEVLERLDDKDAYADSEMYNNINSMYNKLLKEVIRKPKDKVAPKSKMSE